MNDVITLGKETDLVFSPDDGGWYLQLFVDKAGNTKTSKLFNSKLEAVREWRTGKIVWE